MTDHRCERRGFSLIEATISIVIVSIMLVSALSLVGAARLAESRTTDRAVGMGLAEDLLAEILEQPWIDIAPTDGESHLGRENGEDDATRADFDDVDDYAGWTASPPETAGGTDLPDLDGWTRKAFVVWGTTATPDVRSTVSTTIKRITVVVYRDKLEVARLTALRTKGWAAAQPADESVPALLLVVDDSTAMTAQERGRETLLESWGYVVYIISASASQEDFDARAAACDVAYVVEMGQSTILGTKLRDADIGVVCEEAELSGDFGFAAGRCWALVADSIRVTDNTHPITSGLAVGALAICTQAEELVAVGDGTTDTFSTLARAACSDGILPSLVVLEPGDLLYGGGTAAGRRVQLPWGRIGFDVRSLNDDGLLIAERAVAWAAGREVP